MRASIWLFNIPGAFFLVVTVAYGIVTEFQEWVGIMCLLLAAGLGFMVGIHFYMLDRRYGELPEDIKEAEISDGEGDYGFFPPWSWWPFVLGAGTALGFTALAAGWWIMVPAAMVALIGLVGWVFEFSRGRFAH